MNVTATKSEILMDATGTGNVVDALFAVAEAAVDIAKAVDGLTRAFHSAHPFPVDLSVGAAIKEGLERVAASIDGNTDLVAQLERTRND